MRNTEGLLSMNLIHGMHIIARTAFILSIKIDDYSICTIYSQRTQTHAAASIFNLKNPKNKIKVNIKMKKEQKIEKEKDCMFHLTYTLKKNARRLIMTCYYILSFIV